MWLRLSFPLITLLSVVTLSSTQQASGPSIVFISPEQIKDIGEQVTLNCSIANVKNYIVGWQKSNRDRTKESNIISLGTQLAVTEDRFQLNFTKENNSANYVLEIKDIVNTDAGLYECQILVNSTSKITKTVELQVRHPPILLENQHTNTLTKAEGEDAQLVCRAEGYPRPSISWKREYNAILPIGGQTFAGNELRLNALRREDRGTYYCTADNGVGKPDTKTITLEVEFAPVISVPRPKVAQALDYDIDVECVVQAFPAPAISWFRNDKQIHNGGAYSISQTGSPDDVTTSVVKIHSIQSEHFGDYVCKASNKVGQAEARLNLFEQDVPNINYSGLKWSNGGSSTKHVLVGHLFIIALTLLLATLL
ncbi:AGAP004108-PA-like protein [Anopheles sinensis]|uniref:AGAP004108-PA-like protein n=1 Tax=Anopheles sinensis TaxID=74873 RepID=A0A084VCV9_ANOSI|nr:AGAP004108-PA-like protein [Anopheles sinensis]